MTTTPATREGGLAREALSVRVGEFAAGVRLTDRLVRGLDGAVTPAALVVLRAAQRVTGLTRSLAAAMFG